MSVIEGQSQLHSEFKTNLGFTRLTKGRGVTLYFLNTIWRPSKEFSMGRES